MRRALILALALGLAVAGCGGGDSGGTKGGKVTITMWHGQNDEAKKTLEKLTAEFNRTHPKIVVKATTGGVLADQLLQKITAALAGGETPDVAYVFGSDVPSVARSGKVQDLTDAVKAPAWKWDDFFKAGRDAVTVDGRVRAIPALIDSMAVAYNKKLFKRAGVAPPAAGWTWDDYRATAKKLTDAGKGVYGTGWPGVGDEDTVWRLWPMVWQLGGDVLSSDGKQLGFTNESGQRSLELIRAMSRDDKSVYIDTKPGSEQMYQVFGSDRMGMVPTGPWQLPQFQEQKTDYGVAPMPAFNGEPTTISGPDAWVLFDNGDARAKATQTFIQWLTAAEQDAQWDIEAGSLPLRQSTEATTTWKEHVGKVPGLQVFVDALAKARVRPATPSYPKISQATGEAIVSVLLGKADVQQALDGAAKRVDAELRAP